MRWVLEGGWRHFIVAHRALSVCFAGQKVTFDVAAEPTWDHDEVVFPLLVRVSGLTGTWHRLTFEDRHVEAAPPEAQDGTEEQEIPPLVFVLPLRHLLLRNTTFKVDDGFWHGNEIPIPVVFRRTGEKGERQEGVRFTAW